MNGLLILCAQILLLIIIYDALSIGLTFYQKYFIRDFHYPLTIIIGHVLLKFFYAFTIRKLIYHLLKRGHIYLDASLYFKAIIPTGILSGLDIGLSNWSFEFITVSLYTMSKSSCIVFIYIFSVLLKLNRLSLSHIITVLLIASGLFLFTYHSTQFNMKGFSLVMIAAMVGGARWSFAQLVTQHQKYALKNPLEVIYYIQPWMLSILIPLAFIFERDLYQTLFQHYDTFDSLFKSISGQLFKIFIGSLIAFGMEISEYVLIMQTSGLTLGISGIAKEILTLYLAAKYYGDKFSSVNFAGLVVCLIGISLHVILSFLSSRDKNALSDNSDLSKFKRDKDGSNGTTRIKTKEDLDPTCHLNVSCINNDIGIINGGHTLIEDHTNRDIPGTFLYKGNKFSSSKNGSLVPDNSKLSSTYCNGTVPKGTQNKIKKFIIYNYNNLNHTLLKQLIPPDLILANPTDEQFSTASVDQQNFSIQEYYKRLFNLNGAITADEMYKVNKSSIALKTKRGQYYTPLFTSGLNNLVGEESDTSSSDDGKYETPSATFHKSGGKSLKLQIRSNSFTSSRDSFKVRLINYFKKPKMYSETYFVNHKLATNYCELPKDSPDSNRRMKSSSFCHNSHDNNKNDLTVMPSKMRQSYQSLPSSGSEDELFSTSKPIEIKNYKFSQTELHNNNPSSIKSDNSKSLLKNNCSNRHFPYTLDNSDIDDTDTSSCYTSNISLVGLNKSQTPILSKIRSSDKHITPTRS